MERAGRPVRRSGGVLLGRLLPPVMEAREYYRRLAVWNAALALVIAVSGAVIVADALWAVFVGVLSAMFGLRAVCHAWRLRCVAEAAARATSPAPDS